MSRSRFEVTRKGGPRGPRASQSVPPPARPDVAGLFGHALALHQAGRLGEAEPLYRQVLEAQPRHFDSLQLLGVIHYQRGEHQAALRQLDAALKINPKVAAVHNNRGNALKDMGRSNEALASYERAIALKADYPDAFYNHGNVLRALGRSADAVASYDQAIALRPDYAEALSNRGSALRELGRFDEALASLEHATALKPDYAEAWYNRANALNELKRFDEALASYDRAIALRPDLAEAHNNRANALAELRRFDEAVEGFGRALAVKADYVDAINNRGNALRELKRLDEALADYDRAITLRPDHGDAFFNRGIALAELKRDEEALASYDRAIALKSNDVEAWYNRGSVLEHLRRFGEAVECYDRTLALKPDFAEAWISRGIALNKLKRFEEALASCDQAVALRPDFAEAVNNRANALKELRRFDEAIAGYDQALALKPDFAEAVNNRANALRELKRLDEALADYDRAIALRPDYADAFFNRGVVLGELKRNEDALASYERAITLNADHAQAFYSRGAVLLGFRRVDEAIASLGRALALDPDQDNLEGLLLHARMHLCDWTDFDAHRVKLNAVIAGGAPASYPFHLLAWASTPALQLTCARTLVAKKFPRHPDPAWHGERYGHDRIRVAYVSADLRDHPVAYLTAGLFARHDRSRFETFAISFGDDDQPSEMRARLKGSFDRFIDANQMSHREVARMIRDLEIDIAVDLNGFTDGARPDIFAQRPAPVQVSYLGYAGTLGQDYCDYIVADRFVIPVESRAHYAENVVYLPDAFMVNDAERKISAHRPSRAEAGLPDKGFVFCCFNNAYKVTPDLFDVWMRLLRETEGSVLWLSAIHARAADNLRREAAARGVAAERLVFAPRTALNEDHLARVGLADLFLDTLHYNAHATAADALWAGVPVVTCPGEAFASRVAGSLLTAVGLPELITTSLAEYEALALRLARDPARLGALRQRLERNRSSHPLFDTERFTRHLEAAFTIMWERAERGEPPQSFAVAASS
jgi:predicted O-linked N-acetylglucosamine transferase (SPINDLY family)